MKTTVNVKAAQRGGLNYILDEPVALRAKLENIKIKRDRMVAKIVTLDSTKIKRDKAVAKTVQLENMLLVQIQIVHRVKLENTKKKRDKVFAKTVTLDSTKVPTDRQVVMHAKLDSTEGKVSDMGIGVSIAILMWASRQVTLTWHFM